MTCDIDILLAGRGPELIYICYKGKDQSNMLCFLLLFSVLSQANYCVGSGLPTVSAHAPDSESAPSPVAQSGCSIKTRTHFEIIWSCISTLFICTWVSIHPNIPPRDEGHLCSLWRRIKLMLWTLLVPELILLWAIRQWLAARFIAELFKGA